VLVLSVVVSSGAAFADPGDAKARYVSAQSHYNLNEFAEALTDFKEAYRLYPDPAFLFNIAQCERQLGDFEEAIKFYRSYLRNKPDAPNSREVQRKIDELKGLSDAKRKSKEGGSSNLATPTTPPPVDGPRVTAPPPAPVTPIAPLAPPPAPAPAVPQPAAASSSLTTAPEPAASVSTSAPGADLTAKPNDDSKPIYAQWWFWAGAGAVVVGAVVVAIVASSGGASAPSSPLGNKKVF
jgi:tetratricopeptide (TPR) repeat protein